MRTLWTRSLLLLSVTLVAGCSAYQAQRQSRTDPPQPAPAASATAPVAHHGDHQQMVDQFARETEGAKKAILLSQLDVYKAELAEQGKYDCCVKPGCNECVLQRGECHCREGVEKGGPCCGECTAAWIDGRGDVAGLDREEVLRNLGCYRELYEGGPQGDDEAPSPPPDSDHQH